MALWYRMNEMKNVTAHSMSALPTMPLTASTWIGWTANSIDACHATSRASFV